MQALRSDLRGSEWLKAAAEVELVPGDIVFYNSITTETVAVEEDAPQIMDDSADADIALLSLEPAAAEPQSRGAHPSAPRPWASCRMWTRIPAP